MLLLLLCFFNVFGVIWIRWLSRNCSLQHSPLDGVDHLIRFFYIFNPNHLPLFFVFLHSTFEVSSTSLIIFAAPASFAAPAFAEVTPPHASCRDSPLALLAPARTAQLYAACERRNELTKKNKRWRPDSNRRTLEPLWHTKLSWRISPLLHDAPKKNLINKFNLI